MLYLDRTARNGGPTSDLACPTCGSRGSMRYHASYRRHVVDLGPDGLPHESRVWIDRVICLRCRATHALLPTSLVARSPLSARMCCAVLSCCMDASRGLAEALRLYGVCRRTCERLSNDAPRLCAALGCAMWQLASALADAASDASFPARFASLFRTTPFSRVALANAAGGGAAAGGAPHGRSQ